VAAACADKTVRLINAASGELMLASQSHAEQVTAVSFSGDGGRLASASRDGSAKVFDAGSGELLVSYQGHTGPVRGVALLADGSQAFSAGDDKQLHRWNVGDAKKVADVGLGGAGFRLALSADAIWLPAADGRLRRISLADNAVKEFQAPADWLLCTAVSPDGARIAAGSHDGTIQLWNTADAASVTRWQAQPN
jgi:WD40 repeat protein